jgi:hypothetical protein
MQKGGLRDFHDGIGYRGEVECIDGLGKWDLSSFISAHGALECSERRAQVRSYCLADDGTWF